ncbi:MULTISPECIES: hypothetical protein [unclassified Geodermatophilus]|uniref:hypothetical protein n=1 Tax=unclassified Geodermatophilus TaxID=2637632 RepID=UPI003EE84F1C
MPSGPVARRPAQVLGAVLLGFLVAFFALLNALVLLAAASVIPVFGVFGALYLAIAAVNIWGGVQALTGRGGRVLTIGGGVTAGLGVLGIVTSLVQGQFAFWSVVLAAVGAGMVVLLRQPASTRFFAARGGR